MCSFPSHTPTVLCAHTISVVAFIPSTSPDVSDVLSYLAPRPGELFFFWQGLRDQVCHHHALAVPQSPAESRGAEEGGDGVPCGLDTGVFPPAG